MGHGVASALTATPGVGSLRNSRHRGHSLTEQASTANTAVVEHAAVTSTFPTAILGRIDLPTGVCQFLNAGHLPPLLVRDGDVQPLRLPHNFPLGMLPDATYHAGEVTLLPGDRLVVLADGMRERQAAALDLAAELRRLTDLHPREATRALGDAVLQVAGPTLADDATIMIIDWYGGHGQLRHSTAGAEPARASAPLTDETAD
ncbi:PP2C family protein-serine/threonine phosphatase [Dactylosporangium sp. McL0621]|uniref:PP2C family protein-serine/threonine phosphatase n=1 Tax=Dactylosporangium sp. McL0621 TaxID=3415678 RepID=UPI003CF29BB0